MRQTLSLPTFGCIGSFKGGLFNIGGEAKRILGLGVVIVVCPRQNQPFYVICTCGDYWLRVSLVPAGRISLRIYKRVRGSHIVIPTIMFNFIAPL